MHTMQHLDMNMLVSLDALLGEGSVSRAAVRLNLSAAATSHALARLREAIGDPLLVRAGRAMELTPHAVDLREPVHRLVSEARSLLAVSRAKPLAQVQRRFVVRAPDGLAIVYGPDIIQALQAAMPLCSLRFVAATEHDALALREGRIDLDIGPVRQREPDTRTARLFEQHYVGVVRHRHPLARGKVTKPRFLAQQHVAVAQSDGLEEPVDTSLRLQHKERRVVLTVPSAYGALVAASRTDLVASVPARLAEACAAALELNTFALPWKVPVQVIQQAWHARLEQESAHRHLRQVVAALLCGIGSGPGAPERLGGATSQTLYTPKRGPAR